MQILSFQNFIIFIVSKNSDKVNEAADFAAVRTEHGLYMHCTTVDYSNCCHALSVQIIFLGLFSIDGFGIFVNLPHFLFGQELGENPGDDQNTGNIDQESGEGKFCAQCGNFEQQHRYFGR